MALGRKSRCSPFFSAANCILFQSWNEKMSMLQWHLKITAEAGLACTKTPRWSVHRCASVRFAPKGWCVRSCGLMIRVVVLHGDREEPCTHPPNTSTCSVSQEQLGAPQALGEKERERFQQLSYRPCVSLTKPTRTAPFAKFSTASNLRLYLWNFAHWVKILLHLWPGIVPANSIWDASARELLELPWWICLVSSSGLGVLISPSGSTWSCVKAKVKWDKHLNFLLHLAWLAGTRNLYSSVSALEGSLKSKQMFLSLFWKPLFSFY